MRGPSYTAEEMGIMQALAKDVSKTHKQRVEAFFQQVKCDRSPDAVGQKIRKLVSDATPAVAAPAAAPRRGRPPKAAAEAAAPTRTRPAAPAPAAAAPARKHPLELTVAADPNGNGNGNGNGHKPAEVAVMYGALELKGPPKAVAAALTQLAS